MCTINKAHDIRTVNLALVQCECYSSK